MFLIIMLVFVFAMFLVPVPFFVPIVMFVRLLVAKSAHVHVDVGVHVRLNVDEVLDIRVHWRIVAIHSTAASVASFFAFLRLLIVIFRLVVVSVAWSWSATTILVATLLFTVVGRRSHNAGHNVVPHRARRPTTAGTGRAATFGTSAS